MRISTNSKILYSRMSEIEAVKYFAKCGFDTLDLGMLDNIPDILLEDTLKMLHRVGEALAEMVERNR